TINIPLFILLIPFFSSLIVIISKVNYFIVTMAMQHMHIISVFYLDLISVGFQPNIIYELITTLLFVSCINSSTISIIIEI
ncbi:hypothetical protein L9F63_013979, partial [Diploptera punctata]